MGYLIYLIPVVVFVGAVFLTSAMVRGGLLRFALVLCVLFAIASGVLLNYAQGLVGFESIGPFAIFIGVVAPLTIGCFGGVAVGIYTRVRA